VGKKAVTPKSEAIRGNLRPSEAIRGNQYRGQEGGHAKLDEPTRAEAQPGLEPRLGHAKVRAEAAVELRHGERRDEEQPDARRRASERRAWQQGRGRALAGARASTWRSMNPGARMRPWQSTVVSAERPSQKSCFGSATEPSRTHRSWPLRSSWPMSSRQLT
jgi:hypothetical protein